MKKRLRKKLKVAEFTEYGFFVSGSFNEVAVEELDIFFEKLVKFTEDAGLQCGGGYDTNEFEVFVNTGVAGCDNDAKRAEFVAFIEAAKDVIKEFEATEMLDAYNNDSCCGDDDCDCGCHE